MQLLPCGLCCMICGDAKKKGGGGFLVAAKANTGQFMD